MDRVLLHSCCAPCSVYCIDALRSEPGGGEEAVYLLMAAKYFERIGDHATNIAEWAIYAVLGEHED